MLAQCDDFDRLTRARRVPISERSGAPDERSIHDQKRDLRRRLLAARKTQDQNHDYLVRITLTSWLSDLHPTTVAAYVPMIGEPGGPELPDALALVIPRLLLPIVTPDRDLDWALYTGSLAPAGLGLREPPGERLGVDAITSAGVIIVPALAVDARGARLGRGGGSYDRALARARPGQVVIAVLHDGEFLPAVPVEAHDRPVDGIVIGGAVKMLSSGHGSGSAGR